MSNSPRTVRASLWATGPVCRAVAFAMIPGTVLLEAWLWIGRTLVAGGGGWMVVVIAMLFWLPLLLLLLPGLVVLIQARGTPATLRRAEVAAQCAVWTGLFVAGLTLTDFGDAPGSASCAVGALTGLPCEAPAFRTAFPASLVVLVLGWTAQMILVFFGRPIRARGRA